MNVKTFPLVLIVLLGFCFSVYSQQGNNWYVDNRASGANNGASWTDAWQGFSDIVWSSLNPGDIIYISGGVTEKTYYEQLHVQASGSENNPITIKVGQEDGHNGHVIITNDSDTGGGIRIIYQNHITIDGNINGGRKLTVQHCKGVGIHVYGAEGIKLTYLYIYRNGGEHDWNNSGITFTATEYAESKPNIEISYCHIQNNWQDAMSGFGPIADDFGYISIHHNEISNVVDDAFECGAGGVDFYNNIVHERAYDGGDGHPDGIAFNGAEYYRVYNNKFYNFRCGTAYINYEPFYNTNPPSPRPGHHVYIYNNILYEEEIVPIGFIPSHYTFVTPNPYRSGRPDGIYEDIEDARTLFNHLKDKGYIGIDSYIEDKFRDLPGYADMDLDPIYESYKEEIYNIITSYENLGSVLRGISFGGDDRTTTYLSNIVIANNVAVNLPASGIGIGFNNHDEHNITNVIVANNIIHNCYTNGGGTASNVNYIAYSSLIGSFGSGAEIIYDNNIISEGSSGCSAMGYNGNFIDNYDDFVNTYNLNIHGANVDPSLDTEYKPDDGGDPTVNAGLDLSGYFTTDFDGVTRPYGPEWDIGAYEYTGIDAVDKLHLYQNYPNPFNVETIFKYDLSEDLYIEISLFDIAGRKVKTFFSGVQSEGTHEETVKGDSLISGVYFFSIQGDDFKGTKKCVLVK